MTKVFLLYSKNDICFYSMMVALSHILTKNLIENEVCTEINPEYDNDENLWFCIWEGLTVFPKRFIVFNLDPLRSVFNSLKSNLGEAKPICFVNYCTTEDSFIDLLGFDDIPRKLLRFGYSEYYDFKLPPQTKNIDILLYGGNSHRRNMIHNLLVSEFPDKNICFTNTLYNQHEKNNTINRSKIILSAAAHEPIYGTNDLARMSETISNKGFMICEPVGDTVIENHLREFIVYCPITEFVEKIRYYLEHDSERKEMSLIAYDRFQKEFNLEEDFMSLINLFI